MWSTPMTTSGGSEGATAPWFGSTFGVLLATSWFVAAALCGKLTVGNEEVGVVVGSSRIGTGAADP